MNTVFKDEQVSNRILSVIGEAQEYVMVVSPYIALWGHVKNAVQLAVKRSAKVTFLVRNDPDVVRSSDIQWLEDNQVVVLTLDRLHAKIYLNESTVITSSMNLTQSSGTESFEIATLINDPSEAKIIRDYVASRLLRLASPHGRQELAGAGFARSKNRIVNAHTAAPSTRAPKRTGAPRARTKTGFCIRCGEGLSLDVARPLCDDCYEIWAGFGDVDYQEAVCHSCGKDADVSYAKPVCLTCYRALARKPSSSASRRPPR
ncbi:MAG: phospholipase D-like domain-containing protein [Chloroflexi bacterium]|nr:phospholipase D-like domain-containing protein [Chloroflexota bacterium]